MSKYLELFKESFNDSINEKTKLENKPYIGYSLTEGKLAYTVVPKPVAGPADNEIWYTTVDGLPIQYGKKGDNWNDSPQFSLFDFNACTDINGNQLTTLSNEYINGKGIIKLSGNIHTVSRFNFIDQHTITSVVLPKSAIILGDIDEEAMLMMNGPFYGCENLEEIIISQNTTHIGISALSGVKMSQFEIPDNTSLILALAFRGCDKLTSVTIPKSVTRIGFDAFKYCTNLSNISYSGTKEEWNNIQLDGMPYSGPWGCIMDGSSVKTSFVHCSDGDVELVFSEMGV